MSSTFTCRRCHLSRLASEVLEITNVRSGAVSFLCRPSSTHGCFANDVFSRAQERIAAVDDDEPGGDA